MKKHVQLHKQAVEKFDLNIIELTRDNRPHVHVYNSTE